jgi:hypothetical protein
MLGCDLFCAEIVISIFDLELACSMVIEQESSSPRGSGLWAGHPGGGGAASRAQSRLSLLKLHLVLFRPSGVVASCQLPYVTVVCKPVRSRSVRLLLVLPVARALS